MAQPEDTTLTGSDYDPSMIRYCIAYLKGQREGEIGIEDISKTLERQDTFIWLALHEPNEYLLKLAQYEFDLHELAIEDARRAHQRPKLEQYGNTLFIVLKTAMLTDQQVQLGETHMFVAQRFFMTVRHGPSVTYGKVRERLETTPARLARGPAMASHAVMDFVVDSYGPISDTLEDRFEQFEMDLFTGQYSRETIERLYDLKRELLVLRGAAAPVVDITDGLIRFHNDLIPRDTRVYFRDIHDHVIRLLATIDETREMLTAAMQVNLALVSVEQNEAVRRLAGWGAIMAVPTVVFSLYGMNFRDMPELDLRYGYPVVITAVALVCFWLYRRLKHYGWL
jgi:magnesium transporter